MTIGMPAPWVCDKALLLLFLLSPALCGKCCWCATKLRAFVRWCFDVVLAQGVKVDVSQHVPQDMQQVAVPALCLGDVPYQFGVAVGDAVAVCAPLGGRPDVDVQEGVSLRLKAVGVQVGSYFDSHRLTLPLCRLRHRYG